MTTELEMPNCEIYDFIILNNDLLIASSMVYIILVYQKFNKYDKQ